MHSRIARLVALIFAAGLLAGCDERRPLGPDGDDPSLATSGASGGLTAPSNLAANAASPSQINLAWQDNSTNESGFEIHRSTTGAGTFTVLATAGANFASYADTELTAATQYCYKVRAFKRNGSRTSYSASSASACATTPPPPSPPPGPSYNYVTPVSSTAVAVTWHDASYNETGYRVERSASTGGPWTVIATTGANVTSYTDAGVASEQQICYHVIAFNAYGASAPSNADCTRPPAAPTNLTAVTAVRGIDLAWADNSAVETGYEVQRSIDGVSFGTAAYLPANSTSYHDGTALSNTTYWYRVVAGRDYGPSDSSNVATAVGSCVPTGPTENVCDDGMDNDCDGLTDLGRDPDCGEGYCSCELGYSCNVAGFCEPSCANGRVDGDETDVDCGGDGCSTRCQTGQYCGVNADCASGICGAPGICQDPPGGDL